MKHLSVAAVLAAHLVSAPLTALAQAPVHQYEMSEQDLSAALKQFSAASGREVVASSAIVEGKRSRAVNGLGWVRRHLPTLNAVSGSVLVLLGCLFLLNQAYLLAYLSAASQRLLDPLLR